MADDTKPLDATALQEIGAKWIERIRASETRKDESRWLKDAEAAESQYLCGQTSTEDNDLTTFNILHANVETIVPSIYNSTPAPDIRPRHSNKDPQAEFVCNVYERAIAAQIDDSRLNKEIEASAQDAYTAGRGIVRVKFDADIEEGEHEDDNLGQEAIGPIVTNERIIYENVSWNDYREGPAKRWSQVPWVAYRHTISTQEMNRLTDEDYRKAYAEDTPEGIGEIKEAIRAAFDAGGEAAEYWHWRVADEAAFIRELHAMGAGIAGRIKATAAP